VARIHFAWELGNGLGHVARLKPLAVELARRGHEVSMSLRDLVATRALWLPLDIPCVQAPVFLHQTVGLPRRSASLAEDLGYDSIWIPEAWGYEQFQLLTEVAVHTKRLKLATGIANVFSRSVSKRRLQRSRHRTNRSTRSGTK